MNVKDNKTPAFLDGLATPMPNSYELEYAIIGKLMNDKNAMVEFCSRITPQMFYDTKLQIIYKAMLSLFQRYVNIDVISVKEEVIKIDNLENIGGLELLHKLRTIDTKFISTFELDDKINILSDLYQKREIITATKKAHSEALDNHKESESIINNLSQSLLDLTSQNVVNEPISVMEVFQRSIAELEKRRENYLNGKLVGIPTGFAALDRLTGGWKKSTLTILAGRPAMGKTTYAFQSIFTALRAGYKCAFFNLEMNEMQLGSKLMTMISDFNYSDITKGRTTQDQINLIRETGIKIFTEFPHLHIDTEAGINVTKLKSKCLKIKRKLKGLDFIVIDYLQLMKGETKTNVREQEVAQISVALKKLSKEFDCAVMVLAQMSREVEKRVNKHPQLSDLRESGSLEQDADMVVFIHRPEYYQIMQDEKGNSTVGLAEIIIAKQREGALDTVQTTFVGSQSKFIDREVEVMQEQPKDTYTNFDKHKLEITNFDTYANNGTAEESPF